MTVRLALAFTAVAAGIAAIAWLLMPAPASQRTAPAPAVSAVAAVHTTAPDPFLAALAPSTELPPDQAQALSEAADQVCEGLTSGVPVTTMTSTLMAELHLTGPEAMRLVNIAATTRCTADAR